MEMHASLNLSLFFPTVEDIEVLVNPGLFSSYPILCPLFFPIARSADQQQQDWQEISFPPTFPPVPFVV